MFDSPTLSRRPIPKRPLNGLVAWQNTLGYMSRIHSPDAMLKIEVKAVPGGGVKWAGWVSWAGLSEGIQDADTLPALLRLLWLELDRHHVIFEHPEEAAYCPSGYADTEWIDLTTQDVLHRLIWTVSAVFEQWRLVIVYQPTQVPAQRVQARLNLPEPHPQTGGRGANFAEALRDCFRNAVPAFADFITDHDEDQTETEVNNQEN